MVGFFKKLFLCITCQCTSCILWDEIDTFDSVESFNIRKEKLKKCWK